LGHKISTFAYPNPSVESVTIKYSLPDNCKKAWIEIFDMQGNFVKKFNIDNTFSDVILSNEDLAAGSYLYSIVADEKIIEHNKFIVIK
jgi:hypothetical protein